uniref:HAP1 N-terminal domain-containing protein n=1 Tax=Heligmosomoides polygyrus TaxID=6339 RepID=A0A183FZJ8_HELPZ
LLTGSSSLSLMENDMSLLQQLLTLGDQITEMKKLKEKCQSHTSLGDDDDDDSEDQFDDGFSASMSAVTTLCVNESQPQYFSRQNSVLRIPIPPRSSNRFGHRKLVSSRPMLRHLTR